MSHSRIELFNSLATHFWSPTYSFRHSSTGKLTHSLAISIYCLTCSLPFSLTCSFTYWPLTAHSFVHLLAYIHIEALNDWYLFGSHFLFYIPSISRHNIPFTMPRTALHPHPIAPFTVGLLVLATPFHVCFFTLLLATPRPSNFTFTHSSLNLKPQPLQQEKHFFSNFLWVWASSTFPQSVLGPTSRVSRLVARRFTYLKGFRLGDCEGSSESVQ